MAHVRRSIRDRVLPVRTVGTSSDANLVVAGQGRRHDGLAELAHLRGMPAQALDSFQFGEKMPIVVLRMMPPESPP